MVVFLVLLFHDHVTNQKPFPLGSPMPGRHIVKIEEGRTNEHLNRPYTSQVIVTSYITSYYIYRRSTTLVLQNLNYF